PPEPHDAFCTMNGAGSSSELSLPPLQPKSATAATATKPDVISDRHQRLSALAAMVFLLECFLVLRAAKRATWTCMPRAQACLRTAYKILNNVEAARPLHKKTPTGRLSAGERETRAVLSYDIVSSSSMLFVAGNACRRSFGKIPRCNALDHST